MFISEYNGSACELTDIQNRMIATGTIYTNGESVEVHAPGSSQLPILEVGTQVKLSVRSAKLGIRVLAGRIYISNREFLSLMEVQNFADYEKRRFFRQAIDHSAVLIYETQNGASTVPMEIPIRVKDISLCGMRFESDREFPKHTGFQVRIALLDNELVAIDGVVRRVNPAEQLFSHGCEFLELPAHVEQKLCAFIFKEQQDQIRRTRR